MIWIAWCHAGRSSSSSSSSSSSRGFEDEAGTEAEGTSQLEVTIISAQDVQRERYVGPMQAYAVAWINPDYQLRTHMVNCDDLHPTWNARLQFIVDDTLLSQDRGTHVALTIEIYCQGRFRQRLLGTVRVLLCNLSKKGKGFHGAQSLALQIWRPSGRPQGILNIGSVILDYDAALMQIPPLLRNPTLFNDDDGRQKLGKFGPLREFQEICRRSFSVSRDDMPAKEKLPLASARFSLDDRSWQEHSSFDLLDAVTLEEDEEEEAMEALYRKLKASTKGDQEDALGPKIDHSQATNPSSVRIGDPVKEALSKGYHDYSDKAFDDKPSRSKLSEDPNATAKLFEHTKLPATESLRKLQRKQSGAKVGDKLLYEAPKDFAVFYQEIVGHNHNVAKKLQQETHLCDNGVHVITPDPLMFKWNDLTLESSKKKEFLPDDLVGSQRGQLIKSSNLRSIWSYKRASWAPLLRKGAAKIHRSAYDK